MNIGYVKAPLARPDYSFHEGKGENASRGEPARLNGRKVGDILTLLGLVPRAGRMADMEPQDAWLSEANYLDECRGLTRRNWIGYAATVID